MKVGWILLVLSWAFLQAEEGMEVRAYLAKPESFDAIGSPGPPVLEVVSKGTKFEGDLLEKEPFESRFFEKGDKLRDFSKWAVSCGFFMKGEAVYNERTGRLVVRTEVRNHYLLQRYLEEFLVWQLRAEVRVLKLPGVVLGRRDMQVGRIGKGGEELAGLSGLAWQGQETELRVPDGSFAWKAEFQTWFEDTTWDCRMDLVSEIPGAEFSLKTGLVGAMGIPTLIELGSLDGKSTLVASVQVGRVLSDGCDFDDWVQREKGGNVLLEQRMARDRHKNREWIELENGKRYQAIPVPPTFWTFLASGGSDEGREPRTIRELFKENGVDLEEDDRVLWLAKGGVLAVEVSPLNLEMIHGITTAAGITDPPPVLGGSYVLVESEKRLKVQDLKKGGFRILKKICAAGLPGQGSHLVMGGGKLVIDSESQSNADDQYVATRATIRSGKTEILKVEADSKVEVPMILGQEKAGGRWRTWIGEFSARFIEDTIKEGR